MAYELDDLGPQAGDRLVTAAAPAAAPAAAVSTGRCGKVPRKWVAAVVLVKLLVIAIALGLYYYFHDKDISSYTFHTSEMETTIYKKNYTVNAINGSIKGPAIHVKNGWILSVNVTNGLEDGGIGLSIHWHGLNMRGNQEFDGVVGLTQCPIALKHAFLYNWTIHEQPGTYWYHTHDRKMFPTKKVDFVKGPLIIHEDDAPMPENQTSYQWNNEIILFYVYYENFESGDKFGVVNGEEHPIIHIENGEYRFRIINGGGHTVYFFSIVGYNLKVIAADGYSVEPYETDVVTVGIAERYDVMVKFDITTLTEDVCIKALDQEGEKSGTFATLRIRKDKSVPLDETKSTKICDNKRPTTDEKILNCYNKTLNCVPITTLTSTLKRKHLPTYELHTVRILTFNKSSDWRVAIDSKDSFIKNKIPCKAAILESAANHITYRTNVLSLPGKASVTIVLSSNTNHFHPMHSHGHHYEVLEIYAPTNASENCPFPYINTAFSEPIKQLMKRTKQGVLKDTVLLPPCGAVAVRLNSDNPGVWFFHCHIDYHLHHGLAFLLNEDGYMFSKTASDFAPDYPSCDVCGNRNMFSEIATIAYSTRN